VNYTLVDGVGKLGSSVPIRVIEQEQMELMRIMLCDIAEPVFSCSEEEFHARLTPNTLNRFKELKSNVFKLKKDEKSINVLAGG
jgi:hypothetical protein